MKFHPTSFCLLVCALMCAFSGFSQKVWQEEIIKFYDGLPSDIIIKTLNDDKGFLYVSTQKGLSRYDGYRFINHPEIQSPVNSFVYKNGKFYVHDGATGLFVMTAFDGKKQIIAKNNYEDVNPDNDHFNHIFVDSKQRIWCTDFNYIKYFSETTAKTQQFRIHSNNKSEDEQIVFMEPEAGKVWAFTSKGLFVWDENSQQLRPHPDDYLGRQSYRSAYQIDGSNILMIDSNGKIGQFDKLKNKIFQFPETPPGQRIIGAGQFVENKKPVIFVYSGQKIFRLNAEKNNWEEMYRIEKSQINEVHTDPFSGILWIGSTKGLVKLSPVEAVENVTFPQKSETHNTAVSIAQDNLKTIWISDQNNNIWSFDIFKKWKKFRLPVGATVSNVHAFGSLILISSSKGVFAIRNQKIEKLNLNGFPENVAVKKCLLTSKNELWLLSSGVPIHRYSWPDLRKIDLPFANEKPYWIGNLWNDIIENTDGKIWIAGWTPKDYGMHYYDVSKNEFIDIADLPFNKDRNKFFGDYNNRIALAGKNGLLFSGYGGFNRVDHDGRISKKVDINSYPMANGRIEGIGEDNAANVVFATADGLHIYASVNDKVIRISQIDGLPSDDLIYGFKKLDDGRFALGTDNGITLVNIQKLLTPRKNSRLELCNVKIDGNFRAISGNTIELSEDETDLSLYFSTLTFTDKQKIFYRYKFKEDKHWNLLDNTPELSLNHIAPGNYDLIIQAGNHLGQWQSKSLEFNVIAQPPFYKANWFYVLIGLLIVAIMIAINRYLLHRQRKEAEYQQQLKEAEMLTLRTQMNPHFMFNTLNSINSFIIENKREAASGYLTTFSKLMRSILEFSKEAFIPLDDEIRTLGLYLELEAVRLEHSFDYTISMDKELKDDMIQIPPLILQPFVENAIWHGLRHKEQGNLYVKVNKESEDILKIRIEDDGIGRKAAGELKKKQTHHKSYGIDITIQRLEMLHPKNKVQIIDLTDAQGNSLGTAVDITIIL